MINIFKALLIIFIEINVYHLLGIGIVKVKWLPKPKNIMQKILYGFILYHCIFWLIAFPASLYNGTLQLVTIVWLVVLIVCLTAEIFYCYKEIIFSYKMLYTKMIKYKLLLVSFFIFTGILLYYTCINGQSDIDAHTYIGEVSSMVTTNRIVGIEPMTGQTVNIIEFRRSFSLFGVNSAALCKIYQLHPLIFCRITRASINIILLIFSLLELFYKIFQKKERAAEHIIMASMLSLTCLFLFNNTIYTSSRFILNRTYEGKAYCAGTLILITAILSIDLFEYKDTRYFAIIFMHMVASLFISASSVLVMPLMVCAIVFSSVVIDKKWGYIWRLLMSISPNIIYLILRLSGVAYWPLGV